MPIAVARHIGVTPLTPEQIDIACTGWQGKSPLWYYILREADVCAGGHRLGPIGGRIVAEVLIGLIDSDATSFRPNSQDWRPTKRSANCWRPDSDPECSEIRSNSSS